MSCSHTLDNKQYEILKYSIYFNIFHPTENISKKYSIDFFNIIFAFLFLFDLIMTFFCLLNNLSDGEREKKRDVTSLEINTQVFSIVIDTIYKLEILFLGLFSSPHHLS